MPTPKQRRRDEVFPIVEAFGYPYDSTTASAAEARSSELCPFAQGKCEKLRQYKVGYCSVTYAAKWDKGDPHTYAVCDHRLDGEPLLNAVRDHFGDVTVTLVPEVTIDTEPRLNVDYMAYRGDPAAEEGVDLIAIETQAIDLRGGGVGPAWRAWRDGNPEKWREYFSEEAKNNGRPDKVVYGVNTSNVYKRLGTQIVSKGGYLKQAHVPLYVVVQDRILSQLRSRVNFLPVEPGEDWDITFAGFDYVTGFQDDGKLRFEHVTTVRTTLVNYVAALTSNERDALTLRSNLIKRVLRKARSGRMSV